METTTVSPKLQVVIPARVRRAMGIRPGQKVQVIPYEGRMELIPLGIREQVAIHLPGDWQNTVALDVCTCISKSG